MDLPVIVNRLKGGIFKLLCELLFLFFQRGDALFQRGDCRGVSISQSLQGLYFGHYNYLFGYLSFNLSSETCDLYSLLLEARCIC
jgi:hypothetical protein